MGVIAVATAVTGIAITGIGTMAIAASVELHEAIDGNNKGNNDSGKSTYNKGGHSIDYEYYGNGVHYEGKNGK